ncbi:sodium:proton antiporter [Aquipuribacter nitratireducens]|uniref:Sodium:proton antiporter n=1 Tax=Aquipuribacter nitratireducens TaxID=650104 RepID=A0ABW0GT00_9MICO
MNATNLTLALVVGVLTAGGVQLLLQREMLRVVLGFVLLGHAANVVLLVSGGPAGEAPEAGGPVAESADPLVQAMVLTAIVITFAVTALLLALTYRHDVLLGTDDSTTPIQGAEPGHDAGEGA